MPFFFFPAQPSVYKENHQVKMKDVKAGNAYDIARGPAEGSPGLYWDTAEALLNGPGKGLLKPLPGCRLCWREAERCCRGISQTVGFTEAALPL